MIRATQMETSGCGAMRYLLLIILAACGPTPGLPGATDSSTGSGPTSGSSTSTTTSVLSTDSMPTTSGSTGGPDQTTTSTAGSSSTSTSSTAGSTGDPPGVCLGDVCEIGGCGLGFLCAVHPDQPDVSLCVTLCDAGPCPGASVPGCADLPAVECLPAPVNGVVVAACFPVQP